MANYCGNVLTITSEDRALIDRMAAIANPPRPSAFSVTLGKLFGNNNQPVIGLLEFFMPMPEDLKATITNGYSGPTPAWYQWMVDNWGCAFDVAVDETNRISPDRVQFKFYSRYSAPVGAVTAGAERHGFRFRMIYCEPGNQFAGIVTEQGHTEYEFSFDVHPTDDGVPQEIVHEFDLTAIYEELRQDMHGNA